MRCIRAEAVGTLAHELEALFPLGFAIAPDLTFAWVRHDGLSLGDFALHDARLDLLVLVSAKETALADAQVLATCLRELNAREAARSKLLQGEIVRQEWVASLDRFVAGLAHEVNTPLGVALTATSLAVETNRSLLEQATGGQLRKRELDRLTQGIRESLALVEGKLRRAADHDYYAK